MASKRIELSDLLSLADYQARHESLVAQVIQLKTLRRIPHRVEVGPWSLVRLREQGDHHPSDP